MKRLLERVVSWLLCRVLQRKWGLAPLLIPNLVRLLGPWRSLLWMARNIPGYERALAALGAERGNLAFTMASLLNGCSYCAFAHSRGFQLHFFRQRQRLFPLDEYGMLSLAGLPDSEVFQRLEHALSEAGMPEEMGMLRRLFALKYEGARAETEEDKHLAHAIQMYDVLNFCALSTQTPLDDAHDPIYRDEALKARYAAARLALSTSPSNDQGTGS